MWNPIFVQPIANIPMLARTVRYAALNPCRARLVADPLEWPWSTYRDIAGAIVDPWISANALAIVLGKPQARFLERFHAYVSSDPSVNPRGTPAVSTKRPLEDCTLSLASGAALTATRSDADALCRRSRARHLFVLLARMIGMLDTQRLAAHARCSVSTVRRLSAAEAPELVRCGLLCLRDPRLSQADVTPCALRR
jgi:hypothetical protein